jgi:hypothetical protein
LAFLSSGPAVARDAANAGKVLLDAGERGTIAVDAAVLATMAKEGVLVRKGARLSVAPEDTRTADRGRTVRDHFQDQHRHIEIRQVDTGGEPGLAMVNLSESPLGQLMRRRGADGRPFLSPAEFGAGERLRADYTRGRIMPRLGANWEASVASGQRAAGGLAELTDAALAARQRVDAAIAAVGPELSGVLIDVCCFLKGLELVERERGWPVRSAKIILKTALGVLSRHYSPPASKSSRQTLHWGSEGYRPKMSL